MEEDDFAILEFAGINKPDTVRCVLVSKEAAEDASLHAAIESRINPQSMVAVNEDQLLEVIRVANPPEGHPIRDWLEGDEQEDLALGGASAAVAIKKRRRGRGMSQAELSAAKARAEATGRYGESLLNARFEEMQGTEIAAFKWTSDADAIAPYDFEVTEIDGTERHIDAKSTAGAFENPLHMSLNEIRSAVHDGIEYDIYRIFCTTENFALLRVARNVGPKLARLLTKLESMPDGVSVDSVSIKPEYLDFSPESRELGDATG